MAYKPSKPGAQDPSRYPFVGQNYSNWGEQTGFIYDPYRDAYMPDRSAAQNYYQSQGLVKPDVPGADTVKSPNGHTYSWQNGQWVDTTPKQPGLIEQAMPLGVAALAVEGGKQGAQALPGLFSSGGLFSGGAAPVAQGAASGTGAAASSGGVGLLGSGGAASSAAPAAQATGAGLVSEGAGVGAGAGGATGGAAPGMLGSAGLSAIPLGAAALGTAATLAGRDWSRNQGGATEGAWGLINSMNPINQAAEAFGSGKDLIKGKRISPGAALALAIPTGGLSMLGLLGDRDMWKTEGNRLQKLKKNGAEIPQALLDNMPKKGRSFESMQNKEQAADFIGRDAQGNWVNNKFNMSRNVADLRPEDIVNYAAFAEKDPEWFKKPLDQRLQIADQALQAGAVSEGKGSIKVDWKKVGSQPQPSPLPQGNQGRPTQPINQGSPGMRPRNQGRPSQPMRP